jgi:hypothetical protein
MILSFEEYLASQPCKAAVEVVLSTVELGCGNHPGYQKPSIRIEPIFYAPGKPQSESFTQNSQTITKK